MKNIQDKIALLKKQKKRVTPQLLEVLRIVDSDIGHFSASDIYNEARKTFPSISLNTVYSILKKLHSIGEVQKIVSPNQKTNYCPTSKVHHHVACNKCKKIEDVEGDFLDMDFVNNMFKANYKMKSYSILFNGLCNICAKDNEHAGMLLKTA